MTSLDLHLLGGPSAHLGARTLRFRTRKTLALLAVLGTSRGPQRREALAELLWSELEVDGARRELRKTLSYLNAALEDRAALLVTTRDTVALQREGLRCDAEELEDIAQTARTASVAQLGAALESYRGEFMLGFELSESGFGEWLRSERDRARRALGAVAQALIERHIGAGDSKRAVESAQTWVRLDATAEVAHRALMGAHLHAGQPSAALEAFEACRAMLAQELEAGPDALTQRVAGAARAALGSQPPPGLVGRDAAWRALERAALEGGLALVCGEPGIGKTRLALEFAATLGEVLVVRAEDAPSAVPLEGIALALRAALREPARGARLEALDAVWRAEVARLVPEFGDGAPQPTPLPTSVGRARFLEALLRALQAALGGRGVLVLDNLHGFDADSAALVLALARRVGGLSLACARLPELEANAEVRALLEGFERDRPVTRVALGPLSVEAVAGLLSMSARSADAARLHQLTDGNPLYVLEAARHPDAGAARRGVLELVRRRVKRLGEDVQRLLETASLWGAHDFTLDAVRRAAGLDEDAAVRATELALEAGLIVNTAVGHAFSHALMGQALAEGLSNPRKRQLHRRLASDAVEPGRIAEHLEAAGLASEAIPHRLRAAEQAARLHAYRLALMHQDRTLEDGLDDAGQAQVFEARYRLFVALADWQALERQLEHFAAVAARLARPDLSAFVEMGWTDFCFRVGRYAQGIERATRLLRQPLPPNVAAMTHYARGLSLLSLERHADAESDFQAALEHASSDWDLRGWVLNTLAIAQSGRGAFAEALSANEHSARWFEARGDRDGLASAARVTAPILAQYGHLEHALKLLEDALNLAQAINHVYLERAVLEATVKVLLGHFTDAANAGVEQSAPVFFAGASLETLRRVEPWLERCWERAREPFDAFLEPLWRARLDHARARLRGDDASRPNTTALFAPTG